MLLSIIVPTHNRARYARQAISAALLAGPEVEVVVSDTSEGDELSSEFADAVRTGRLKVLRPGGGLSVVDNFNAAIAAASGRFLLCIGDDDLVTAEIREVAAWAEGQGIDAVRFTFPALYFWPDFRSHTKWNAEGASLQIQPYSGSASIMSGERALFEAVRDLGGGVKSMPRVYAGMISRSLKERICQRYGSLFGGVSPDIFSAALIAREASTCVEVDYPVVVPGASGASTSGQSAAGRHSGELRANSHIAPFKNLVWDPRVPEFYSVPSVWGFSLLKAVERWPDVLNKTNFGGLYVRCLAAQPSRFGAVLDAARNEAKRSGWARIIAGGLQTVASQIGKRFSSGAPERSETIRGLNGLDEARLTLQEHIVASGQVLRLPSTLREENYDLR